MRDPFAGYDAWLERPYQDMIDESDRYYDWCEAEGYDPDSEEADLAYCAWMDSLMEEYNDFEYEDYDDDWEEPLLETDLG